MILSFLNITNRVLSTRFPVVNRLNLCSSISRGMSSGPDNKRSRTANAESVKTIGTHNGVFHCDEVLGCYMLKLLHPGADIVRTRDDELLKTCDIVIDVGAVYDPETNRFDHHQRDFNESMNTILKKKWTTKLSSAGLVYCYFGADIIRAVLKRNGRNTDVPHGEFFDKIYEDFVQEIDGIDNGVPMYEGEPSYRITTNLSTRIGNLNKKWNQVDYNEKEQFEKAMELAGAEFTERILYCNDVWWPARDIVKEAIVNRFKVCPSGEIIELKSVAPWKDHFFDLESKMSVENEIKFVIFKDSFDSWRVQAVPVNIGSFVLRLPLFEEWRGLRDNELSKLSGIDDCVFVHHSGFIGGHKCREGALLMAVKTLELTKK